MDPRVASAAQRLLLHIPNRRRIYEAVVARPGMHVRGLSRELGIALGSVEHHIRHLERHGLVFCHEGGRRHTYYATGQVDEDDAACLHALRKPLWACLARAILDSDGCGVRALASRLGMPATTVSYNLRRMHATGLLDRVRVGRESLYVFREPERVTRLLQQYRPESEAATPEAAFVGLVERARPEAGEQAADADPWLDLITPGR